VNVYVNLFEFIVWILRLSGSAAMCASGSLCGNAHYSVRVVRAIVCGSALGSLWQYVRQCAAVRQCSSVRQQCERQCVAVYTVVCAQCALQCVAVRLVVVYGSVRGSVRRCGSMRQCAHVAVCGSARCSVWQWVAACVR
jgi:hypothetical protein